MSEQIILNIAGVNKRFGGLAALTDVGIKIMKGQIYGLIAPTAPVKPRFFNVITGLYQPDTGTFELAGKPYSPSAPHEVAKAGIARTFQNIRLFGEMTALEKRHGGPPRALAPGRVRRRVPTQGGATGRSIDPRPRAGIARFRRHRRIRQPHFEIPVRMATSAAWKSPAPWPPTRNCWRWTNRPPA